MSVFSAQGPAVTFTGATTAPTSVQPLSANGINCNTFRIVNESITIACVIGWGATDALAKANAAAGNSNCAVVPAGWLIDVSAPANSYFSGITPSATAVIYVQSGLFQA